jgi:RNA polymerase subunit RPABC4/transcription elongation factor Spt4
MAKDALKGVRVCLECDEPVKGDQKFCPKCGAELPAETVMEMALCKKCSKQNDVGTDFCTGCGAKLPYKEYKKGIIVLLEFIGQDLIYGALYTDDTKKIRVEMQESDGIRPFYKSKEFTKGVDWLFYKSTSLEDAYDNLKNLIERMTNQIG